MIFCYTFPANSSSPWNSKHFRAAGPAGLDLHGSRNHRHSCFTAVCSQIFFRFLELLAFLLHSRDYGVSADLFSFLCSKLCSIFIIVAVFSGAVIYCLVTTIYSEAGVIKQFGHCAIFKVNPFTDQESNSIIKQCNLMGRASFRRSIVEEKLFWSTCLYLHNRVWCDHVLAVWLWAS